MQTDLRRAKRYNDFIPVSVTARDLENGTMASGPFSGRIINISTGGACLLLPVTLLDVASIYHTAKESIGIHIEMRGTMMPEQQSDFVLSGDPVWMAPFRVDDLRAYRIGVSFLGEPDRKVSASLIGTILERPAPFTPEQMSSQ